LFSGIFLSPLRDLVIILGSPTHGSRPFGKLRAGCGLHSCAASRLEIVRGKRDRALATKRTV
jgi:hypothetical protein